jgi:RNA polymerase sigma-70 factor (ECF subfamily)
MDPVTEPLIATSVTAVAAPDEPALIERARTGDAAAFEALIAPRLDTLFRTAWAIVGNEADARDATQDACISAWKHLPRLRDSDRLDAWLGRVLVNSCRMLLRRQRRVREIAIPDAFEPEGPTADRADAIDEVELVARAFDRLDPDARALLVLHHLRHEPVARIAASLGIPVGTVKWRLHAARKALENALEGERR